VTITVETTVCAPIEEIWRAWNTPDDIKQWNTASKDWHTTQAAVDLRVGGSFSSRMEAKDAAWASISLARIPGSLTIT
jgi:uncharacterized protein YndB with AHSA1/START domain